MIGIDVMRNSCLIHSDVSFRATFCRAVFVACLCGVSSVSGQTTVYDGSDSSWNNDDWNNVANWDSGIPSGTIDVLIGASETASVLGGGGTPPYAGMLTIGAGATLHINDTADNVALGTGVVMQAGSRLILVGGNYTVAQGIRLEGDVALKISESTGGHHTSKTFTNSIQGEFQLDLYTGNNNTYKFQTSNSFSGVTLNAGNSRMDAEAGWSLGIGDVTVNDTATLRIYATNSIVDTAVLSLNGGRDGKLTATYQKLHMAADEKVGTFRIDDLPQLAGTWGSVGSSADHQTNIISGSSILTVRWTEIPPVGTLITLQ